MMHNPAPRGLALPPNSDKVIHFCAYFALAMMGVRSAFSRQVKLDARWLVKWIIIYTVYCAADELLQGPVGRHPSLYDWLADIAGAAAALGIAYVNRPGEPESQE
ncbi:MAG: VanZ family protein [Phycisphaerae bacterium]|nr:VanZ family protein [Phycisphaerae bacterium]